MEQIRVYESFDCDNKKTTFNVIHDKTGFEFVCGKIIASFEKKQDAVFFAELEQEKLEAKQ